MKYSSLCIVSLMTCLVSMPSFAQKGPQLFVGAGFATKLTPYAFDRYTAGMSKSAFPVSLQAGLTFRVAPEIDAAALVVTLPEVDSDGSTLSFPIGEVRVKFTDGIPGWVSIGAGRIIGQNRKQSWIETISYGFPLSGKSYLELRHITDEGSSSLNLLTFGIKI